MENFQVTLSTDTWLPATWEEYLQAFRVPAYDKAKSYYHNRQMRIEMPPVGPEHAADHGMTMVLISLFSIARSIPIKLFTNCSYRQAGVGECQPDLSFYTGERIQFAPYGGNYVDLHYQQSPDLAIEISDSSLSDDLGQKRLLYEDLGVAEYWVIDTHQVRITAFTILTELGSLRINESRALPGLDISLFEEALKRSRRMDSTQVSTWFMGQVRTTR
ncbi:MAG: Uma2 family endonuclease [Scytolyngbya sp. HA4215-MV1]|jgi:Uma2 family endonuclease|nr:Uma2 family endonuclease [Scytolyngbya sp. HA4215-MV1]